MAFDRSYFDPVALRLFYSMIVERQRIYWRRLEGQPPPWTNDPIMRTEFITNVYRELDPGTVYLIENILNFEEESFEDKLLNVIMYRLMGSREDVQQVVGFWRCAEWNEEEVLSLYRSISERGENIFGEAYRTASYTDMGGSSKVENVCRLFTEMVTNMSETVAQLRNCQTPRQCYEVLNAIHGLGEFLAYQIWVDLLYPAPHEPLLPFDQDTWCMAGPGARRGIWRLLNPGMKPANLLEVMTWLRENQRQQFAEYGLEMPYLQDDNGNEIEISLCNIQSCLCEFYKYARIWDKKTQAVRKYFYKEPLLHVLEEPAVTFLPPTGGVEGVGDVLAGANGGAPGPLLTGSGQHGGLVRSTIASTEQLQLVGGGGVEGDPSSAQAMLDGPADLDDPGVLVSGAVGQVLNGDGSGSVLPDVVQDSGDYVVDRFANGVLAGGSNGFPSNALVAEKYDPAAAQARVYAQEGETVQVVIHSSKRVKHLTIEFD